MSTNKAHPHAELMKLYAEDAAETDKPWVRWEMRGRKGIRVPLDDHPDWDENLTYRRKPTLPTPLQGHTMEQWDFIKEQGFDCEFSHYETFSPSFIGLLTKVEGQKFHSDHCSAAVGYCRPRRARGVKQPWFGGECPIDKSADVLVFWSNGLAKLHKGGHVFWSGTDTYLNAHVNAFIEL